MWCFLASLAVGLPNVVLDKQFLIYQYSDPYSLILYSIIEVPLMFYPVAGFLADNYFGRYKVVTRSLYVLAVGLVSLGALLWTTYMLSEYTSWQHSVLVLKVLVTLSISLLVAGELGFRANLIQFGMDQLYDFPSDHQSLFIHWNVWAWSLGGLVFKVMVEMGWSKFVTFLFIVFLALFLTLSLALGYCHQNWFLLDSARLNPYKLVYQVTRFAWQHKVPVKRSAFTYCEDEIPTGLNLGKTKYGGPFTTEQVEDVKTFYGILTIIFTLGGVFFLDISTDDILYQYSMQMNLSHPSVLEYLVRDGWLTPFLTVLVLPVYIFMIRPFFSPYMPGMLCRIGLSIVVMIASCASSLAMETAAHVGQHSNSCMFERAHLNSTSLYPSQFSPIVQRCLSSLSTMLLYPALYEFICSQSPHTMKGLLLGLGFAVKGLFEFLGLTCVLLFTIYGRDKSLPSCGMEYYVMNIVVGVAVLVVYCCVSRSYRYRVRDEPCLVHRYVEEYYSKTREEQLYDCSMSI